MAGTALVTGASSGIGEETAKGLLAAGYIVYAGARRVDAMRSLEAAGARVLSLDVTDDASMTAAVDAILRETGRIDVLARPIQRVDGADGFRAADAAGRSDFLIAVLART
jgi:NADP-dependent 3-hydroxy acid dehydrogenase YdfG